jgi:hypothetical protein
VRPKGTARHGPRHLGQRDARRWPIVQAYPLATRVSSADKSASCATTNTEPRSCVDPACPAPQLGRPHVAAIRTLPDVRNASDSRPGSYGCSLRQDVSAGCGAIQLCSLGASCLEMPKPTTFVDSSDRWRSPIVWMVRSLEPATPAGGL